MTTTPQPQVDIEELEALAKAATPGPWCQHPNGTSAWQGEDWEAVTYAKARVQNSRHVCNATSVDEAGITDMEFIVAMRNSIDALIAETRALRAVKLRVHELAGKPWSSAFGVAMERALDEIERITR